MDRSGGDASDEALVAQAQRGDRTAMVQLYQRYVNEIYGFAYNQLGTAQDAEDLTSETFLHLVRALGSFRGSASFRTWLYAIARNTLHDHWRRNGRRPAMVVMDPERFAELEVESVEPAPPNPNATALGQAVLNGLPPRYRQVIELRVMDGLSIRDTAEVLKISEANVKVLLHRALKRAAEVAGPLAESGTPLK